MRHMGRGADRLFPDDDGLPPSGGSSERTLPLGDGGLFPAEDVLTSLGDGPPPPGGSGGRLAGEGVPPPSGGGVPPSGGSDGRLAVYTDGACLGNPGPGGWAWVVPDDQEAPEAGRRESGHEAATTNQRMELTAVLEALTALSGSAALNVYSDSRYVVDCFEKRWWEGWKRRGWRNSSKQPVKNQDLWRPLLELALEGERAVKFHWVKAHYGNRWNELADLLAYEAARAAAGAASAGEAARGRESARSWEAARAREVARSWEAARAAEDELSAAEAARVSEDASVSAEIVEAARAAEDARASEAAGS